MAYGVIIYVLYTDRYLHHCTNNSICVDQPYWYQTIQFENEPKLQWFGWIVYGACVIISCIILKDIVAVTMCPTLSFLTVYSSLVNTVYQEIFVESNFHESVKNKV